MGLQLTQWKSSEVKAHRFMVAVFRYSISEIIGFLVTNFGIFIVNISDNYPPEPFTLDLKFLFIWPFFPHLCQVANDLVYDLTTYLLYLPL